MKTRFALIALAALVLSACTNPFAKPAGPQSSLKGLSDSLAVQGELKKFSDADEVREFFEGRPQSGAGAMANGMAPVADRSATLSQEAAAPDFGGGGDFSGTNIQVAGVDESDIIKTDGKHIYSVSDKNVLIFKAEPAAETALVATLKLEDRPQELYLSDTKLVVFGYKEHPVANAADLIMRSSYTFLSVYDITDPAAPKLLRSLDFEGGYTASRLVDGNIYFITTNYNFYPLADAALPRVFEDGVPISSETSTEKYAYPEVYYIDTPSSYNTTTVSVINLDQLNAPLHSQVYFMPSGEILYASRSALYLSYTKYINEYQIRMTVARELLFERLNERERERINQIAAIDPFILSEDEKTGKVNQIIEGYLNRLSMPEREQVTRQVDEEFNRRYENIGKELEKTVIHKIGFDDGRLAYAGTGEVSGRLLNQYSLDEHEGFLRLATTRSRSWFMPLFRIAQPIMPAPENESYNNVYVLDDKLATVGAIEDLAEGERIYSARFMGDRAYVVTFRQVDPLFVLDLSDPQSPAVSGELKIPGFSNYLHPYDETTLIGVGKSAVDRGDQGVEIQGLKLSLFDVADPAQPREVTSLELGGSGSDSTVLFDPKAFLFDRTKGLIVIPASLTKAGTTDYQPEFQGAIAFTVTKTALAERGRVAFRLPGETGPEKQYIDDTVRRNLYIGDFLYSYTPATLKVSQLANLSPVRSLELPLPAVDPSITPLPYAEAVTDPAR